MPTEKKLIECVPNFSEGRNPEVIQSIVKAAQSVEGVSVLNVDPGKATHRTVLTFAGEPEAVIEAAFRVIKASYELIDMRQHTGEHPRMGATDVCPLIPLSNITMEETVAYAQKLGQKVGEELQLPVYLYESAARSEHRKNLAHIRAGEYEGLEEKFKKIEWQPDYGPAKFIPSFGAVAIGARDFLIAYNVNLNTTSVRKANAVAFDVREIGRTQKVEENGKLVEKTIPGKCKSVKAIGWFIEEYGLAQVSMNLTNINDTNLHQAYEACWESANKKGYRVTGSELIGMVPLKVLLEAAEFYLNKQKASLAINEKEKIKIAVKSLGLDELSPFVPEERIIEYKMKAAAQERLAKMNLIEFADETASENPAPGGGSVSAYVGSLGAALACMVANISLSKTGVQTKNISFSLLGKKVQENKKQLIEKVDQDTLAFHKIIEALRLPSASEEEKIARKLAIEEATLFAIETPKEVAMLALDNFELIEYVAKNGNPNAISDAGVAALCSRTCVLGACYNMKINAMGLEDKILAKKYAEEANRLTQEAMQWEEKILAIVNQHIQIV
jgi:glutamate formiminotransferase / formiminotetrahydrofolate cyclodeaminase